MVRWICLCHKPRLRSRIGLWNVEAQDTTSEAELRWTRSRDGQCRSSTLCRISGRWWRERGFARHVRRSDEQPRESTLSQQQQHFLVGNAGSKPTPSHTMSQISVDSNRSWQGSGLAPRIVPARRCLNHLRSGLQRCFQSHQPARMLVSGVDILVGRRVQRRFAYHDSGGRHDTVFLRQASY